MLMQTRFHSSSSPIPVIGLSIPALFSHDVRARRSRNFISNNRTHARQVYDRAPRSLYALALRPGAARCGQSFLCIRVLRGTSSPYHGRRADGKIKRYSTARRATFRDTFVAYRIHDLSWIGHCQDRPRTGSSRRILVGKTHIRQNSLSTRIALGRSRKKRDFTYF